MRLRYYYKKRIGKFAYITCIEPQGRGSFHHLNIWDSLKNINPCKRATDANLHRERPIGIFGNIHKNFGWTHSEPYVYTCIFRTSLCDLNFVGPW
jgi:hypothetical protein